MTEYTPHETALIERVASAIDPWRWLVRRKGPQEAAEAALTSLGLIGPDRTHWLAPWEATEEMERDYLARPLVRDGRRLVPDFFSAMRDAHLKSPP